MAPRGWFSSWTIEGSRREVLINSHNRNRILKAIVVTDSDLLKVKFNYSTQILLLGSAEKLPDMPILFAPFSSNAGVGSPSPKKSRI
jgi:hypothetical protein